MARAHAKEWLLRALVVDVVWLMLRQFRLLPTVCVMVPVPYPSSWCRGHAEPRSAGGGVLGVPARLRVLTVVCDRLPRLVLGWDIIKNIIFVKRHGKSDNH